jgi:hypothetical protein
MEPIMAQRTTKSIASPATPIAVTGLQRWFGYLFVTLALGLGVIAGMWVGRAWTQGNSLAWTTGIISLLCAVMVAIAGLRRTHVPTMKRSHHPSNEYGSPGNPHTRSLPLLGELLIHKYQLLTQKQLDEALKEQRDRGGRLGQILIAMGYIEYPKLIEVLEDQVAYGDPWRGLPFEEAALEREKTLMGYK